MVFFGIMMTAVGWAALAALNIAYWAYLDPDWTSEYLGIDITPLVVASVVAIVMLALYTSYKRKGHLF